jgi:hypothetical protein
MKYKNGMYRIQAFVYSQKNNLILFKLGCYKFKILIVISKLTTEKKIHRRGKKRTSKWHAAEKPAKFQIIGIEVLRNKKYKTNRRQVAEQQKSFFLKNCFEQVE